MKTLIKSIGIIAVIVTTAIYLADAIKTAPRAKLRTYAIGKRWYAEIEGVKSQDMKYIAKSAANIAALVFPLRVEESEQDGGEV